MAAQRFLAARFLFRSSSFFNFDAELKTPLMLALHAAYIGSLVYLLRVQDSQK
jgi:hypothetical protein